MLKETIISIIIVVSIITLDFITQDYTKESVKETTSNLSEVKNNIEKNTERINELVDKTFDVWEKRYSKLAYFIEHDELEKVKTNLINMKSYVELNNFDMAISSIEETEFVLEHIQDKNSFNLQNIF